MISRFTDILTRNSEHPILVDIGASGQSVPNQWEPIAPLSIYVGFDPDSRELYEQHTTSFYRHATINKAVVTDSSKANVSVYLTRSPYCSSTLNPDSSALEDWAFSDLFQVESVAELPAIDLATAIKQLDLERIDWIKTDSQGTDLRLFNSLPEPLKDGVLAIDIEPGLIAAYEGEDRFADAHIELTRQGFWLSDLVVLGTVRVRRDTLSLATGRDDITYGEAAEQLKVSPGWCEARYLRTTQALLARGASERNYLLLWGFALLDHQIGFATDVARTFAQQYPADEISHELLTYSQEALRRALTLNKGIRSSRLFKALKQLVPARIRERIRRIV